MNRARSLREREWIVTQIGARHHYTTPLGFEQLGCLHSFYTDLWVGRASGFLRHAGGWSRALAGRYCPRLPPEKVFSFTGRALCGRLLDPARASVPAQYERHIRIGRQFAEAVNRHLLPRLAGMMAPAYYAFNTGALETLRALSREGVPTVVEQIDPARFEEEIVLDEIERWPGWQDNPGRVPDAYYERLQAEWSLADVIAVNSAWCRDALIRQSVPSRKIAIVPIAYAAPAKSPKRPAASGARLRVLWLGQVILRKGIQYLVEAARLLQGKPIEIRVVGPIGISRQAIASAPANITFEGPCPRLGTHKAYSWADVFILPTLSDAFAITQLEALAAGLPVITTPNCGDVVTHGMDGLIVPVRDAQALASAMTRLAEDRGALEQMSREALRTVTRFQVKEVAPKRLASIAAAYEQRELRRS